MLALWHWSVAIGAVKSGRQNVLAAADARAEPADSNAINFPPTGGGYGKIGVKGHPDPLFPVAPRSSDNYGETCMGLSALSNDPLDGHVCQPCKLSDISEGGSLPCAAAYWQCRDSLCHPLCTEYALKCDVSASSDADADGFFEALTAQGSVFAEALCAQISARWCSLPSANGGAGCCSANDHALFEWVESKTYDDSGLKPLLPLPQCAHDSSDPELAQNMCAKCMKSLEITISSNHDKCEEWGSPGGGTYQNPKMSSGLPSWRSNLPPILPKWLLDDYHADMSGGARSMREKCDALAAKVEATLVGGIAAEVTVERVCQCLGCCDLPPGQTDAGTLTCMTDLTRPVYSQSQADALAHGKLSPEIGTLQQAP